MADFQFLQNPISKIWVILAPRRAKRPDIIHQQNFLCPFCPGREEEEKEELRIGGHDDDAGWAVRVLANEYALADFHEIIIQSPDHHKSFDELPLDQVERVLMAYRQRFQAHQKDGAVYIFNNHGSDAGESIPHPHTQLVVIPEELTYKIQPLVAYDESLDTNYFHIFCPQTSEWPDEVWIAPIRQDTTFGELEDVELSDLAIVLQRIIQLFDMRHGHEFPYNFYIYPGKNWYLRIMPRTKSLGGFEIGTGIMVNTLDPKETFRFIKSYFANPEVERLEEEEKANFAKGV